MKTADPELMRAINRFHVMDAIRRFGPIARVEISDRTELSATTVSAITGALLDDGLIITHQLGGIRDAARGRPRVLLDLNPDAAHVVGARLAPDAPPPRRVTSARLPGARTSPTRQGGVGPQRVARSPRGALTMLSRCSYT